MRHASSQPERIVVIGHPAGRRTELFRAASSRRVGTVLQIVTWADLLSHRADLREVIRYGDIVRIDSPGKDDNVERLLLRAGRPGERGWASRIDRLPADRGRIWWPEVWYHGFCNALDQIAGQLRAASPHRCICSIEAIKTMFDKTATHAQLARHAVPVSPAIGRVAGYVDLLDQMRDRRWSSAFVKLAYGSSASGAIAFRISSGGQMQAFTTVELDGLDEDGQPRMYNTRRIRQLSSPAQIGRVVDAVCQHGAHVERWIPKAGIDGRTFDLRVLLINGRPCHTVVRLSRTPMTNLQLLNARSDAASVRERCGPEAWEKMMASCVSAAGAFPRSLYMGADLLIAPDFRRHAILELNAFGDLLQGASWHGMDPYDAELAAIFGEGPFAPAPHVEVA